MVTPNQYIRRLGNRVKEQRGVFILYSILRLFVVLIGIRSVMLHNYDVTATCLLVLALFFVPSLLEETLKIRPRIPLRFGLAKRIPLSTSFISSISLYSVSSFSVVSSDGSAFSVRP